MLSLASAVVAGAGAGASAGGGGDAHGGEGGAATRQDDGRLPVLLGRLGVSLTLSFFSVHDGTPHVPVPGPAAAAAAASASRATSMRYK